MIRPSTEAEAASAIPELYDRRAREWAEDRGRRLQEGAWLDRLTEGLAADASVLDAGCGSGFPIAAELMRRGFQVTGLDIAPRLLGLAAEALPNGHWVEGDLRTFHLGDTFDAVIAWFSLFHLTPEDQEQALSRLIAHCAPRARLMFTAGDRRGVIIGEWRGEPLYHASLEPERYRAILGDAGFKPQIVQKPDPTGHVGTVCIAERGWS